MKVAAVGNIALSTGDRSNTTPNDPAALLIIWKTRPMHGPDDSIGYDFMNIVHRNQITVVYPMRVHCGGTLKIIAAILSPTVIAKVLTHLGLSARAPPRSPRADSISSNPA